MSKKKKMPHPVEIQGFWEAAEENEPDISTERLIAMVYDCYKKIMH